MTNQHELSEREVIDEIAQFAQHMRDFFDGKRDAEPAKGSPWWALADLLVHPVLAVLTMVARPARAYRALALLARVRIATDRLSYEPRSCGLNGAYTNLGLARLGQNDVAAALVCLDASWRVHPCPHNTSFGLRQRLATALQPYLEARPLRERYARMSAEFVSRR
jgi:hypothetical protein